MHDLSMVAKQPIWPILKFLMGSAKSCGGPLIMERTRQPSANSDVHRVQNRLSSCTRHKHHVELSGTLSATASENRQAASERLLRHLVSAVCSSQASSNAKGIRDDHGFELQRASTFSAEMSGSCEMMSCEAPNTAIQACIAEEHLVQQAQDATKVLGTIRS